MLEYGDYTDILIAENQSPPTFDYHASLMDLPRLLNTTLDTIPDRGNFLAPPPGLTDRWGQRIAAGPHQRIGLTWAGNAAQKNDHNRSMDANFLRPLTEIPNLSLYSLQLGRPGEAVGIFGNAVTDLSPLITDFADTAAAMQHLDLIISVDTSVAHLAGTLDKPVWALLCFDPDWRWLLERDDSPWYPTMRLFRQTEIGDWAGVITRVGEALREFGP